MHPLGGAFRVVLPVKDPAKAKSLLTRFFESIALPNEINVDGNNVVIDGSFAPKVTLAKLEIGNLHTLVKAGHAEVPARGPKEALHVVYRPSEVAQIAAYTQLERAAGAASGASVDPSQRERIMKETAKEAQQITTLVGPPDKPAVDHVDLFGRLDGKNLAFEARATPGPASRIPPPDAWKPAASFAPDDPDAAFVTFSRPLVSAWPLAGDPPNVPFTKSDASHAAIDSGFSIATGFSLGIPIFAHLSARISGFNDNAYAHFDRAGMVMAADGTRIDIGLLSKTVTAAEAACLLATKQPCPVAERLKVGGPAAQIAHRACRLIAVKGTTQLALACGDSKAPLDALKLHATTADPLDGSIPQRFGGTPVPWIAPSQHLVIDGKLDGNAVSATLVPAP